MKKRKNPEEINIPQNNIDKEIKNGELFVETDFKKINYFSDIEIENIEDLEEIIEEEIER